jgi:AAA family ATP:ADP antiporter
MLWAFAQFFLLIGANYLLRPVRESLGSTRGSVDLKWLYSGTFVVTMLATTAWSAIVGRVRVRRILTFGYEFFAASFLVLWALLRFAPDPRVELGVAYVFFVWYSAYVLFAVSMFWSRNADLFSEPRAKRLFPFVASGGSLGAIAGSASAATLATRVGTENLLLGAVLVLQAVVFCSRRLAAAATRIPGCPPEAAAADDRLDAGRPPPAPWTSLMEALRSRYLVLIAGFILFATLCGTVVYTMQSDVARATFPDRDERTEYFGRLDLAVNVLSFLGAAFLSARLIRWIGVGTALFVLPSVYLAGFFAAALSPVLARIAALQISARSAGYGITTPAREILFTIVPRDAKYRAKNAIDTFVWRGGDVVAIWLIEIVIVLGRAGAASAAGKASLLARVGIPLALLWLALVAALWREHRRAVGRRAGAAPVTAAR